VISFPQVLPPKPCIHISSSPTQCVCVRACACARAVRSSVSSLNDAGREHKSYKKCGRKVGKAKTNVGNVRGSTWWLSRSWLFSWVAAAVRQCCSEMVKVWFLYAVLCKQCTDSYALLIGRLTRDKLSALQQPCQTTPCVCLSVCLSVQTITLLVTTLYCVRTNSLVLHWQLFGIKNNFLNRKFSTLGRHTVQKTPFHPVEAIYNELM
jgi:hypothetical protein